MAAALFLTCIASCRHVQKVGESQGQEKGMGKGTGEDGKEEVSRP